MITKQGVLIASNYRFSVQEKSLITRIATKLSKIQKKRVSDNEVLRLGLKLIAKEVL